MQRTEKEKEKEKGRQKYIDPYVSSAMPCLPFPPESTSRLLVFAEHIFEFLAYSVSACNISSHLIHLKTNVIYSHEHSFNIDFLRLAFPLCLRPKPG